MENKRKWQWLHEVIYDLLFSIHGGVNGDFQVGWRLANKYASWVQKIEAKIETRKSQEEMDESIEKLLGQTKTGIIDIKKGVRKG